MKTLIMTATAFAFAMTLNVPAFAGMSPDGWYSMDFAADSTVDKRRKPRVKGGSGCDDPGDVLEHPECR
jgi:hypothetical protein